MFQQKQMKDLFFDSFREVHSIESALPTGTSPRNEGFYFPAEWCEHEATLMAFPTPQNWPIDDIRHARADWAKVARAIATFEPVVMIANEGEGAIARSMLPSEVEVIELPINDAWMRDTGPLFLVDGKGGLCAASFGFNSWGEKFLPWNNDAALKGRVCGGMGIAEYVSELILEGGAITVDGDGTLITTESVLLNANRNPSWSVTQIEVELSTMLGVDKVIWLAESTVPDPYTDGHVDGICAFVAPGRVLLHMTADASDPNHAVCVAARDRLRAARDSAGRALEIIELPLAKSHAHINFYLPNGGVVVPISGTASEDDAALGVLRDVYPDRKVVGVKWHPLGLSAGGGGVHCVTQQVPARVSPARVSTA